MVGGYDAGAEERGTSQIGATEGGHGPSNSAVALLFEDDAGPDAYVGMDVDPSNVPLLPLPTTVPPPPLRGCEQRHCMFHAAEGVHEHRLSDHGLR